jgi:hypothetical protein
MNEAKINAAAAGFRQQWFLCRRQAKNKFDGSFSRLRRIGGCELPFDVAFDAGKDNFSRPAILEAFKLSRCQQFITSST